MNFYRGLINGLLISIVLWCGILALTLSGCCTAFFPHNELSANVKKHLGRPISLEKELDIRVYVDGPLGIYGACNRLNPIVWLLSTPLLGGYLFGCSERQCGENKMWESDKICTCEIHQSFDWDWIYQYELRNCQGYGEW